MPLATTWTNMNRDLRLIALSLFTWALGEGLFLSFVTLRLEELGATPVEIGNVMALYALVMAVVMIPAGIATDRWGAWRVMIGAWFVALLAVLLMALSGSLWGFAAGWVAYGLTSWIVPALTTYVTNGCGSLTPQRALAMTFASYSAGLILSPLAGGLIGEQFGLQAPFAVAIVFVLASIVAVAFAHRDLPHHLGMSRRYDTLLRNRPFILLLVLCFVVMSALWLGVPFAPNYLQTRWDIPIAKIGLFGSAEALGGVILILILSRWSPQFAMGALQIGGIIYLATLLTTGQTFWLALAFFLRIGPVYGRQFFDCIGMRLVPPSQRGLAFAITPTIQRLANMLASIAAGWLYEFRPAFPFQVAMVLVAIAFVVTLLLIPHIKVEQEAVVSTSGESLHA